MKRVLQLAMLTALIGMAGCNFGAAPPPIEIGHVSDKSRTDKAGDQAELGIRLALHDLSKDDAVTQAFGGRKIQVRHTNAQGQPDAFESEAVRLDSISRCVALLGGLTIGETTAIGNAKLPLLSFSGQPASGQNSQTFYLGMAPTRQGVVLAKVIAEDAKAKHIAIVLDEKRPEAIATVESFQKSVGADRKIVKLRYSEDPSAPRLVADNQWHDLTERMIDAETHTVVFAGSVQDFNGWHRVLRKEFPDASLQIVFAGPDGSPGQFDVGKSEVIRATAFFADPASAKITTFLKAYRDAFSTDADVHSALAYDGMRLLVEAMKRTPTQLTAEKIREELLKTKDFEGLTGLLTINADRQVQRPLFVVHVQNGTATMPRSFPAE